MNSPRTRAAKDEADAEEPRVIDPLVEAHRQWVAHGWEAPDEMVAATAIIRAQQIVVSRMHAVLRPRGLSFPRFEVLVLLYVSRRGVLTLGKVSERLMVHPTSVTNLVDRLVVDGLVERKPSEKDRRTVLAEITPAGRATVEEIAPKLAETRFGLTDLGPDGSREMSAMLSDLRRLAGDFVTE